MNILDIIILLCFAVSIVQGIWKGFIAQVIAIISIIAGIWISFRFAEATANFISSYIEASDSVLMPVSFTLILILVILGFKALGKILEATVNIVLLGWLNRLLGAVFAALKCALIAGLIIMAFNSLNNSFHIIQKETLDQSRLYKPLKDTADKVFPYLKGLTNINK